MYVVRSLIAPVVSYRNSTSNHNCVGWIFGVSVVVSYRNSTSNHNGKSFMDREDKVVSYRNSTSNHNTIRGVSHGARVVSYRNSTSNHNPLSPTSLLPPLYLIEILHQTTTVQIRNDKGEVLYLIEILHQTTTDAGAERVNSVVSYRNSTSNHNIAFNERLGRRVVSYRNSTSNHNTIRGVSHGARVVSYRNSTSNHNPLSPTSLLPPLYLIEILHQTTTVQIRNDKGEVLYLIEILHQTTTKRDSRHYSRGCILSKFYIKPQRDNANQ